MRRTVADLGQSIPKSRVARVIRRQEWRTVASLRMKIGRQSSITRQSFLNLKATNCRQSVASLRIRIEWKSISKTRLLERWRVVRDAHELAKAMHYPNFQRNNRLNKNRFTTDSQQPSRYKQESIHNRLAATIEVQTRIDEQTILRMNKQVWVEVFDRTHVLQFRKHKIQKEFKVYII